MNTKGIVLVLVVLALIAGGAWLAYGKLGVKEPMGKLAPIELNAGTYEYICTDGVTAIMTPSDDATIVNVSVHGGAFPSEGVLVRTDLSPTRYENGEMYLVGVGEEITLSSHEHTVTCNPVPSDDMAPWNWGDAGEGAGRDQGSASAVSTGIVGKWKSVEEAAFVREFKADGTFTDSNAGTMTDDGTWRAYDNSMSSIQKSFPLQSGTVYIELVTEHDNEDVMDFTVGKLTPDSLELISRQNETLSFTSIP